MSRALAVLLLGAALSGCGGGARSVTDQEACARQAEDDPVVKEMIVKGAGNPHFQIEGQDQLRAAKQDANLACLRRRGVVRAGGVERQKPL
jgi:hypothetical protein